MTDDGRYHAVWIYLEIVRLQMREAYEVDTMGFPGDTFFLKAHAHLERTDRVPVVKQTENHTNAVCSSIMSQILY
jgi:hypothetical protein